MYHNYFHVRFFRIVFDSGKFVIKADRRDKKMKSFPLSELESVQCQSPVEQNLRPEEKSAKRAAIIAKDDMIQRYNIDENNWETMWKFRFILNFTGRKFQIACRTF